MNFLEPATTLAQRIRESRIPAADALRYGLNLAESLQRLHDSGFVHGAVSPDRIALTETGLELLPPTRDFLSIASYTAPEVVQGQPPDIRSDIFSFGTVLFELLTGKRAFEGHTPTCLGEAILNSPTPLSGIPAADRLLSNCLAKQPNARMQRMRQIILEFKLLGEPVRRVDGGELSFQANAWDSGLTRSDLDQMEVRIAARLEAHERTMGELQRTMAEAVHSLRAQLNQVVADSAPAQRSGVFGNASMDRLDDSASERILARVDHRFQAIGGRISHLERNLEEIRSHQDVFENSVAADLADIEETLKVQAAGIESARTETSQTEDLVERVVEALESLQTGAADPGDHSGARLALVS